MLKIWIILAAASCAVSAVITSQKKVFHGDGLILKFPKSTAKLKFQPANSTKYGTIWQQDGKVSKITMKSSNNNLTLQIDHVTFDYEGTYTSLDVLNKTIFRYKVMVNTKRNKIECSPGETLSISLEGIKPVNYTLYFYKSKKVILVKKGVPVGNTDPDYINRLKITGENIKVLNVNLSDVGRYRLIDHKGRLVSDNTMILVVRHSSISKKALISLVLLGIPAIICCYCIKKKCCEEDNSDTPNTNTLNAQPESVPMCQPVSDPSQGYTAGQIQYPPPVQGQIQYPPPVQGQIPYAPSPYAAVPPPNPNPVYPPGPLGPPVHPPHWNAPPNPPAPVNYNPLMNSVLSVNPSA